MAGDPGAAVTLPRVPVALAETLLATARVLTAAKAPWWVIGSAAVALHGAAVAVGDVDVLLAEDDARRLLPRIGLHPSPGQSDGRFRSSLFARWNAPALAVELMSGLHVAGPNGWTPVNLLTRVPVALGDATLFVPDRAELVALLHRFGRAKDLARAALLDGSTFIHHA